MNTKFRSHFYGKRERLKMEKNKNKKQKKTKQNKTKQNKTNQNKKQTNKQTKNLKGCCNNPPVRNGLNNIILYCTFGLEVWSKQNYPLLFHDSNVQTELKRLFSWSCTSQTEFTLLNSKTWKNIRSLVLDLTIGVIASEADIIIADKFRSISMIR